MYRPMTGPAKTATHSLNCCERFEAVMAKFTAGQRHLLTEIVLKNQSVATVAAALKRNAQVLMGVLEAVLDLLVEHLTDAVDRAMGKVVAAA
jgi:hypothetical protein